MTDHDKIYIVSEGEYSDYSVLCAYLSEDDARAAVESGVGDDYTALPLLPAGYIPRRVAVYHAFAGARLTGDVEHRRPWSFDQWEFTKPPEFEERESSGGSWRAQAHYTGTDRARVEKAAHDRAARLRAEQEGIA